MIWRISLFGSNLMYNSPVKPLIHPQDQKKSPWMQNRAACQGVVRHAWNPIIQQSETGGLIRVQVWPGLYSEASSKWKHVKVLYQLPILLCFDFLFHCISLCAHSCATGRITVCESLFILPLLSFLFVLSQCISLCASCGTGEPASACQLSLNYLNSIQGRFQEVFILFPFARERWPPTSLLLKHIPTVTQITKRWLAWISSKNYFSFFSIVLEFYTHM